MLKNSQQLCALALSSLLQVPTLVHATALPVLDWVHGAKRGTVIRTFDHVEDVSQLPPCLAKLSKDERAKRHFAEIRYRHIRTLFHEIGELPDTITAPVGAEVEIYPKDCDSGTISRVTRLLEKAD